jgi:hypothetical protein
MIEILQGMQGSALPASSTGVTATQSIKFLASLRPPSDPATTALATRHARGLQYYTIFGISIGIKRRMIDIGKKITFYFLPT